MEGCTGAARSLPEHDLSIISLKRVKFNTRDPDRMTDQGTGRGRAGEEPSSVLRELLLPAVFLPMRRNIIDAL
jgi:hypothetical protein